MEHIWTIYDLERVTSDGMVTKVTWACESYLEEKMCEIRLHFMVIRECTNLLENMFSKGVK